MEPPFDVDIRVGEIIRAEPFPEARKPELAKLWIDLGDEDRGSAGSSGSTDAERSVHDDAVQSAAQLLYNHDVEELVGRQVLCATNLGTVNIAGFESEVLTLGVPDGEGHPVLVTPDGDVPLGGRLH